MRELEFLPDWYGKVQRQKRQVALRGWLLLIVICALGAWISMADRNAEARATTLMSLTHQLDQKHTEKAMLDEQLRLRQELQTREQLISSIGYPVEMTRLLQTLDSVMPREMSLVDFDCSTDETVRTVTSVAAVKPGTPPEKQVDRRLKIRLIGVTPSDVDLANLYAGLTNVPFFENLAVSYARDKVDAGHVFREFEITFSMNINQPAGN